jgi:hypothetical protein
MATITELDPMQVKAQSNEVYAEHLKLLTFGGETLDRKAAMERIEVIATAPNGEKYPHVGKIAGGGYEFDPASQVMEVMVEFSNPEPLHDGEIGDSRQKSFTGGVKGA